MAGLDVYMSPNQSTFLVEVDPSTGRHNITIDPEFQYIDPSKQYKEITKRSLRYKRSANTTEPAPDPLYKLKVVRFQGQMSTFITLYEHRTILLVQNLQNRLVLTLPHNLHNLKESKFYIVLYGTGGPGSDATQGKIFFRQDQPHIDLFVFFSVFFSCFFIFLAMCVLIWKVKQAVDTRQSRQRRIVELATMASRPTARISVIFTPCNDLVQSPGYSPVLHRRKKPKKSGTSAIAPNNQGDREFSINPVALEPTDDGIATVGTFIFQLPGGNQAPLQACFGSCLVNRVGYSSLHHGSKTMYSLGRQYPSGGSSSA